MRFYVIENGDGVVGCELTLRVAHARAAEYGIAAADYTIVAVDAPATADTIRRLLGEIGSYATAYKNVWPRAYPRFPRAGDEAVLPSV